VRKLEGKMIAIKGTELARKEAIVLTLDVPLQPAMKESLPKYVQAFFAGGPMEDEAEKRKTSIKFDLAVVLNIHALIDNKKSAEPVISKGGNDDGVTLAVKEFFFVENDEFMRLKVTCHFDKKMWAWGGGVIGDGEIICETKPSQETFDFQAAEEADDDEEAKPRKKKPAVTGHSEVFDGIQEIAEENPEEDVRPKSLRDKDKPEDEVPEGDKIAAAVTKRKPYQRKISGDPVHTPITK
jgi:hypothetical protein